MEFEFVLGCAAFAAIVPAAAMSLKPRSKRDATFWILLALALAGPAVWVSYLMGGHWRTGISVTLWLTVSVSLLIFVLLALATRHAWRLTPLMLPYMLVLAFLAVIWQQAPEKPFLSQISSVWLSLHIGISVLTYACATTAAVAALSVLFQERAMQQKRPNTLTRQLPSIADCDKLQRLLLIASATVLLVGLISGMAAQYIASGSLFQLDHKTLLSVIAFTVIAVLLAAHYGAGVRGRRAARAFLVAYLLLTLAFPGVKFVTDVILT